MPSLTSKDRVSLCLFTFEDGRRCRTPRTRNHPHFCFYHSQKEAQARAAETLGKDLAYFFSGDYVSACDLSTALSRLIPAVIRGDIKPRLARTVAYMFQTQLQAIHLSQREYINAFGTDGRVGHPLFAEQILTLSFSLGWPILAGSVHARVGLSFSYFEFLPSSLLLFRFAPRPLLSA